MPDASVGDYKGLTVSLNAASGLTFIQNQTEALADRIATVNYAASTDPDVTYDGVATYNSGTGPNFYPGSKIYNTVSSRIWECLDNTTGAAVWVCTSAAYAPGVATLSIASSLVATDATKGTDFDLDVTGNFTLSNPTGMKKRQPMKWWFKQSGGGGLLTALGSKFLLPTTGPSSIVLSTTIGYVDLLTGVYIEGVDRIRVVAFTAGYTA